MAFSEEFILWKEFHDGMSDVEDIIHDEKQAYEAKHGYVWNPRLDEWEECVREWWCSRRYEPDRKAYKKIYDMLIVYYDLWTNDHYFDNFDFSVEFCRYGEKDMSVKICYDLIGDNYDNSQELFIEGTRDTIAEEIVKALRNDPVFPEYLKNIISDKECEDCLSPNNV